MPLKPKKIDHYEATKSLDEKACRKYCAKLADADIALFTKLSFDRKKLIDGYFKMYYKGK